MFKLDNFKDLLEIQSLENHRKNLQQKVDQEDQRLSHIRKEREKKETLIQSHTYQIQSLKKEHLELETSLFEIEKKLQKAKEQYSMIKSSQEEAALEKVIRELETHVDEISEKVLERLEKNDSHEQEIQEMKNFLEGSNDTLNELKEVIKTETAPLIKQMEGYEERILALMNNLPTQMKSLFEQAKKKHINSSALAYIRDNGSCEQCRYHLDQTTKNDVELMKTLNTCPSCGRILIPLNTKS